MNIILPIVTSLAVLWYMLKRSRVPTETNTDGKKVLKFNVIAEAVGWVCLLFSVFVVFIVPSLTRPVFEWESSDWVSTGLVLLFFISTGVTIIVCCRKWRLLFDDTSIEIVPIFAKRRVIEWKDIQEMKFNEGTQSVTLRTADQKIDVTMYLNGFQDFINMVKQKIDPSISASALEKLDKVYKAFGLQ
ncbi:MAG: hypothetical protein V4674_00010 [Patescibacteria group bacterium]